jgi:uncharacterized cupredoxin-like copper-binding protein
MLPHALFCALFPMGLDARRGVPQDDMNTGQSSHPPDVHRGPPAAAGAGDHPGHLEKAGGTARTRTRRRWAWALVLTLAALALAVPLIVARRHEPTPSGTPVNVLLKDFKVQEDTAVVPAGAVSFRIRNQGPTTHEFIVVRTNLPSDKLPLQSDGLTVNEEARGIALIDEADGLDIDDRQTLVLDLAPGQYVMYCNLEGHYLGGMHAALTVR